MSIVIKNGTVPKDLCVKSHAILSPPFVQIGDYEVSLEDFLVMAYYVLTIGDLREDDPRRVFVELVKSMEEVEGWNQGGKRLNSSKGGLTID